MTYLASIYAGILNKHVTQKIDPTASAADAMRAAKVAVARGEIKQGSTFGGLREAWKPLAIAGAAVGAVVAAPVLAAGATKLAVATGGILTKTAKGLGGFGGTMLKPTPATVEPAEVSAPLESPVRDNPIVDRITSHVADAIVPLKPAATGASESSSGGLLNVNREADEPAPVSRAVLREDTPIARDAGTAAPGSSLPWVWMIVAAVVAVVLVVLLARR